MLTLQTPAFKKIEAHAQATPDCISFSQGALRVGGTPLEIREHVREILKTDRADYYVNAFGIMPLRERIAGYLHEKYGVKFNAQQIFVTHGAVGALTTALLGLLHADDEVVLPAPTYPVYQNIVKMAKAVPVFVDALVECADACGKTAWKFDIERVKSAITPKTKMIVIANPSNPTGMSLSAADVHSINDLCQKHKIYFISDEVYEHFVFEGDFYSATALVAQSEYVIRIGSFSKNFSMSGWRVGFLVCPPHMLDTFSAIQSASICCPTAISQYAVLYALDHPELMNEQIKTVKQDRDIAYQGLLPLVKKGILSVAYPKASFYLFAKTPEVDCSEMVMDILQKAKVALAPGKDFGPFSTGYFRLCYARDPGLVEEGIARLVKYFEERY